MTMIVKDNGVRVLIADEDMWLQKGDIFSKEVSLAYDADPSEWIEITDEEYRRLHPEPNEGQEVTDEE